MQRASAVVAATHEFQEGDGETQQFDDQRDVTVDVRTEHAQHGEHVTAQVGEGGCCFDATSCARKSDDPASLQHARRHATVPAKNS